MSAPGSAQVPDPAPTRPGATPVRETIEEVRHDGSLVRAFSILEDGSVRVEAVPAGHAHARVPGPGDDEAMTTLARALATAGCERSEYSAEIDGERRDLVCRTIAVASDRVLRVTTDVTPDRDRDAALRESEATFRHLVEHAADALFVLDEDNRIVMVNHASCSSLQYDEAALLRMQLGDITPFGPPIEQFERWKATGDEGPFLIEATHQRRDGTTFDVEVHVRRTELRGRPHYVAFVRDVTERTRVRDALRQSEATMRSLVEHAPAVIVVSDLEGRARFVSDDLPGWDRRRLIGKRLSSVLPAGDAEELERALGRIRSSGRREDVEVCILDPAGGELWLSVRIARVDPGEGPGTLVHIVQDVTDARRTREALRASEARFRQLVDQAVDGIYVFDAEGRIVDANARGCESLGLAREELLGRSITDSSPGLALGDMLVACRQLGPRGSVTFETVQARRDGRAFPVELRIGKLVGGGPPRFVALARDISDRQNLERAALDAIEREQRRFGRDLHDGLGQDLAGIAFLAKALEGTLALEQRPEAARAAEIARRVAETITQTRAMAHGLAPVGVHGDELATALEALATDTSVVFGVRCRVECDVDIARLDAGTATGLYRIAQEAVTNALRHARAGEIVLSMKVTSEGATLRIRDDGRGIQAPAARPVGLGLQIMALRARRLGGRLEVGAGAAGGTLVACVIPPRGTAVPRHEASLSPRDSPGTDGGDGADPL